MSQFPVTEAALSGFHLIRRRPTDVLAWTALRVAANLAMGMLLIAIGAERLSELQAIQQSEGDVSFAEMGRALITAWPVLIVLIPLKYLVEAVLYGALFRARLRPEQKGLAHMRLGRDEMRLIAVSVAWTLATSAFIVLLFGVTFAAGFVASLGGDRLRPFAAMLGFVLFIAAICAMVWLLVRVSLAWAATFERRDVEVFGAWRLTHGHFWNMAAAYVLALAVTVVTLIGGVVLLAVALTFVGLGTGVGLADIRALFSAEATDLAGFFTLGMLVSTTMEAVVSTAATVLLLTPVAEIYKMLSDRDHGALAA